MAPCVHQPIHRNARALCDLVIIEVVRSGDLDSAGTELRIGIFVGYDRNEPPMLLRSDRDFAKPPDDGGITLVRRMHRHRAVPQHGLGPGGGDGYVVARLPERRFAVRVLLDVFVSCASRERIFEMPHMALGLDVLDFEIRDGRLETRIPVHQALAAINKASFVQVGEHPDYRIVEILPARRISGIPGGPGHGERFPTPVAGRAKALKLLADVAPRLVLLLPDEINKLVPREVGAAAVGFGEIPFNDHLGGYAGMVRSRLPQRVEAPHPMPADQYVLQRVVERMAHVKRAGNVGRRNHDAECLRALLGVGSGGESPGLVPSRIDSRLGLRCIECLLHWHWLLASCPVPRRV